MRYISLTSALVCLFTIVLMGLSYPVRQRVNSPVQGGFAEADTLTVQHLKTLFDKGSAVKVIDVRLPKDLKADPRLIPSATWLDPSQVEKWAKTLTKGTPIVVYCVHGHRVSQQVAERLLSLGYPTRRLAGGIEAWKEVKGNTVPLSH